MHDVLPDVERWLEQGLDVAVATVVSVWGSAPRRPGSAMAVSSAGGLTGSVSGGCVEGAVVEAAREVLDGGPPRLLSFGVSDEDAWEVGLSCGGEIRVFVERWAGETWDGVRRALHDGELVARAVVLSGSEPGTTLLVRPGEVVYGERDAVDEAFRAFAPQRFETDGAEVFVQPLPPRPKLILVGAVHTAVALTAMAREVGFTVHVVDPRAAFATPERFAPAYGLRHLHVGWPADVLPGIGLDAATYVAVLSHDPKIDLPALELALRSPARYVGALGSKKTHGKRIAALTDRGFTEEEIGRIRAPIGLDLGGRRPEEIAVSILAEIVRASHGR
jgi:xanthine dehydrogenase accessory factor